MHVPPVTEEGYSGLLLVRDLAQHVQDHRLDILALGVVPLVLDELELKALLQPLPHELNAAG